MTRYFFDVQDGEGVYIDETGTELADDIDARAEATAAVVSMAKEQVSRTTKSENIVMWVRRESGEALAVLTFSFALLSTSASPRNPVFGGPYREASTTFHPPSELLNFQDRRSSA